MVKDRYQVSYRGYSVGIEPYSSRHYPWHDDDGYTWEEAREEAAQKLEAIASRFNAEAQDLRTMTEEEYFGVQEEEEDE